MTFDSSALDDCSRKSSVGLLEVLLIAVLLFCITGAAILSVAEVSIIRVRRSKVLVEAMQGHGRSKELLSLIDDLPVVLNTVLAFVLLLQVVAATIGGFLAQRWFGGIGVTVASILITAVLFVYAEAVPKTRAVRAPQQMALRLTPLLRTLVTLLRPFVAVLVKLSDLQTPETAMTLGALTEEEIRALARESAQAGNIADNDASLVDRSFEFNDSFVGDVLVPHHRIAAVAADQETVEALSRAIAAGHRRLPVYGRGLDDIIGMVRLRDLAATAKMSPRATAESIMTEVLRCRREDPIAQLLRQMQASGIWMAIVADRNGRTVGLVTVEDLVAELVGEIADDAATPVRPTSHDGKQ